MRHEQIKASRALRSASPKRVLRIDPETAISSRPFPRLWRSRDEVTSQQEHASRISEIHNQSEISFTREPLPVLIHTDEVRSFETDRESDLLSGHAAAHEFGYGFHEAERNTPFRMSQRSVASVNETLRYNSICPNSCDGTMLV
jgi:hypothetical protein